MGLVGCYVTPHPPIIVPDIGRERLADVRSTVDAMLALGRETALLAPDTIVLLSPHAPIDARHFTVCLAGRNAGSLAMFGARQIAVDLEADQALAQAVVAEAESAGLPVLGRGRPGSKVDLDHGAVVPLFFLLGELPRPPRFVELGFSFVPAAAHLAFGQALARAAEASGRRVVFVASGDMSHRLIENAPAGYTPLGREFDASVEAAFAAGDEGALLGIPPALIDAAGECGYRSLLVLFGALRGRGYTTRVLSYEGPFGVGYLVGAVDLAGLHGPGETARTDGGGSVREEGRRSDEGERSGVVMSGQESTPAAADALVALARAAVETHVRDGRTVEAALPGGLLADRAGVFVSLHEQSGALRGCLGTFLPTKPSVAEEIVANAIAAATRDPRFAPVTAPELAGLHVSVDVLGEPEEVAGVDDLDPRRYGLIVRTDDGRQALLLPDLEGIDTAEQQLAVTCRKGGISVQRDHYRLFRFGVQRHT